MNTVQPIRNKDQIQLMKDSFKNDRDRFLFITGINSALRISDILKLKVRDLQGTHIILKEQKTGKAKRQIISTGFRKEIDKYIKGMNENDYLFPSRKGTVAITRVQAHKILSECADRVGVKEFSAHSTRKSFGYFFYKQTKDIAMLQKLFSHSSPMITMRYIGLEQQQQQQDDALKDFSL
ncbi:tyrosine-type recombinase/integrase [Salipaludibacillus sp. HK11]|uniref:tyrosine-type recombinase/integrase n=1 Tax=Salipaludibacillus sp. HK11 TaxID=3394320 RepID=UPI0039FDCC8C